MTTGREVVLVALSSPMTSPPTVGVKRRNQTLFSGLTVTSLVEMPLTGVALGEDLRMKKLKRRRLNVPLERQQASVKNERSEMVARGFQGIRGLGLFVEFECDILSSSSIMILLKT